MRSSDGVQDKNLKAFLTPKKCWERHKVRLGGPFGRLGRHKKDREAWELQYTEVLAHDGDSLKSHIIQIWKHSAESTNV